MHITFLSAAMTFMVIYVWARRNPSVIMNFLGIFNFPAPYMPFVLLGFSFLLNGTLPKSDALGIFVGHLYYYSIDIYPRAAQGRKLLNTPSFLYHSDCFVVINWCRKRLLGQEEEKSENVLEFEAERSVGAGVGIATDGAEADSSGSETEFFADPEQDFTHED